MALVDGLSKERMLEIEASSVVDGIVDANGNLILTKHDGTDINAGSVIGPQGDPGAAGADAAPGSVSPTPNTTPIRTSDGRVKGSSPTSPDDLTPKGYIDTLVGPLTTRAYVDNSIGALNLDDTGWVDLTPASGWASSPTTQQHVAAVRRIGSILHFHGVLSGTLNVATSMVVATIPTNPEGLRPPKGTNFNFIGSTGGFIGWSNINELGQITIHFKTPYASGPITVDLNSLRCVMD